MSSGYAMSSSNWVLMMYYILKEFNAEATIMGTLNAWYPRIKTCTEISFRYLDSIGDASEFKYLFVSCSES